MSLGYSTYVVPDETTEGQACYRAYHPELTGCMSHGATIDEAIHSLESARTLYLATLKELGQQIPAPKANPEVIIWQSVGTDDVPEIPMQAATIPSLEMRQIA
jgi:predicted RNase H-like HicB family nuclease